TPFSTPRPVVDHMGRVVMVLAGRPRDEDWDSLCRDAYASIMKARARCSFTPEQTNHRRGSYPVLPIGVSFGGGQRMPGNLAHSQTNKAALEALVRLPPIRRLAGFAAATVAAFAPRLYRYYSTTMNAIFSSNPTLRRNFTNSAFPSTTFNFGPMVATVPHFDTANLSFGWCSITALGSFDSTRGGHIIAWALGLVIRFPSGATIDLPSAIFEHSNVTIQEGETRASFTQYAAGGLFRYVANGLQTDKQL
ncbi:hypothetical protein BD410DRAFT_699143, partial [Rickenella mellea]